MKVLRCSLGLIASILLFISNYAFAQDPPTPTPCTEADYLHAYTACTSDNKRDLLYYKDPASLCEGGVAIPNNVFDLPCDISCVAGTYLPVGQRNCSDCREGEFSLGGGVRILTWSGFPTPGRKLSFTTYGAHAGNIFAAFEGGGWSLPNDTTMYIQSGAVTHNQASVLALAVNLVRMGSVKFSFKVDAEVRYDGIYFMIDGAIAMPLQSVSEFRVMTYTLNAGYHLLQWVYTKDFSINMGQDRAIINMIEVVGLNYADDACTACAPGTFNPRTKQGHCELCYRDSYSNVSGATLCTQCPVELYALDGAVTCLPRPECTVDDVVTYISACTMHSGVPHRDITYDWVPLSICDTGRSTILPEDQFNVSCGQCNGGQYRQAGSVRCEWCGAGQVAGVGSTQCVACAAGTYADRGYYVTQWDDWHELPPFTTYCSGSCGSFGWQLEGSHVHSGIGHGRFVNSKLSLFVELKRKGSIKFEFEISCRYPADCVLKYLDEGYLSKTFYHITSNPIQEASYDLEEGNHTFHWSFVKASFHNVTNYDRVLMKKIVVTGMDEGGAAFCTNCSAGTTSTTAAVSCTNCPAGHSSTAGAGRCSACPEDTFNPIEGGDCIACGHATHAPQGSAQCFHDCSFSPDNGVTVFDLSPLKRSDYMYGPIYDEQGMSYYINVCSLQHNNYSCYDALGQPIASYACQVTLICSGEECVGMNLGDVIGFYPLPEPHQREGLIVSYTHGTVGCDGKERALNITMKCAPGTGVGYPQPPPTRYVENPPCEYNIVWETDMACPVCSAEHYSYYVTPCENDERKIVYYWKENPKRCHDGVALPPTQSIPHNCTNQVVCALGQYVTDNGTCEACSAGSYSVGPGTHFPSFDSIPSGFTSSCFTLTDPPCLGFVASGGMLVASSGTSVLSYAGLFLLDGSVAFNYKVLASGAQEGAGYGVFTFAVDGITLANISHTSFDMNHFEATIPEGTHLLQWSYEGGDVSVPPTSPLFSTVLLSSITLLGTDYSPLTCTPCEGGMHQVRAGAVSCEVCPENTFAASGATNCIACAEDMYSVAHSKSCEPRRVCSDSDYQLYFTPCLGGTRSSYYLPLQPSICVGGYRPPPNASGLTCAPCPEGTRRFPGSDECSGCPVGQYLAVVDDDDEEECVDAVGGVYVMKSGGYFGLGVDVNEGVGVWPANWSTTCFGHCGSSGWRHRGTYVDSGFHAAHDSVMSVLTYTTELVTAGSVSFQYIEDTTDGCGLQFFINGVRVILPGIDVTVRGYWATANYFIEAGTTVLSWVYIQNPSSSTHVVNVKDVVVSGECCGAGVVLPCPAGSSSGPAASTCVLCPAGYFASAPMSSLCEACPNGTYSEVAGAEGCAVCLAGTHSTLPSASTSCSTTCLFTYNDPSSNSSFSYDLSSLKETVIGPVAGAQGTTYEMSMCGVYEGCGDDAGVHVCQVVSSANATYDWGSALEFVPQDDRPKSGFTLVYHNGDSEGCTGTLKNRETVVVFECDVAVGAGYPHLLSLPSQDPCALTFLWDSILACPVCSDADYDMVMGSCENGKQHVEMIRRSSCNGPASYSLPTEPCTDSKGISLGYVILMGIGVLVILVIMTVVIVVVVLRHRRMSQRYHRLLEDQKVENDQF